MKKVLVIGSGGRCHAIVDSISQSKDVDKIYCAPGNPGIAQLAECVPIETTDIEALKAWAIEHQIDLTVVGPEAPLSMGIVDVFREAGLTIFGHTKAAMQLETSKEFAKKVMKECNVPTAEYEVFDDYNTALNYIKQRSFPTVIKYDGLAAGKGVVVAKNLEQAQTALEDMLVKHIFGNDKVIIEEFLEGEEFSMMCLVSKYDVLYIPPAQDFKRAFDNNEGPNTGGMGAYTNPPFLTQKDCREVCKYVIRNVATYMADHDMPLTGVLYAGMIATKDGFKVLEFNARFGDPETEVILPLLMNSITSDLELVAEQKELEEKMWWDEDQYACGVVLASKGYPGTYEKGYVIKGTEDVNCKLYHMGTAFKDGQLVTDGGRVLMVVATDPSLEEARRKAYEEAAKIKCDNLYFRKDIALSTINKYQDELHYPINGKILAEWVKDEVKDKVEELVQNGRRKPKLAVISVGDNAASKSYIKSKIKACEYVGIDSQLIELTKDTTEAELTSVIDNLNYDLDVDGILVQLPIVSNHFIQTEKVIESISTEKDVDGFHSHNVGQLWSKRGYMAPCTPKGIMYMLNKVVHYLDGKVAVVVGRSNIVGKPMAKLLLDEGCTVIMAHSRTKNLESITKQADILVVAVGKKHLIKKEHVKPGAVVIDVGINRGEDGKLYGDVDYEEVKKVAKWITPVPGGVGPMTVAMLMENTLQCYLYQQGLSYH